jgi:hypothetical protein
MPTLRFDLDMNILNLAIDQESLQIVQFLSTYYHEDTLVNYSLVNHKYQKGMQAIHQVMSLGHLSLIKAVIEMGADINVTMHDSLNAMHCAAQTYHGLISLLVLENDFNFDPNL